MQDHHAKPTHQSLDWRCRQLIDEIDIRIRMSLPSSHGTEQVQFIDMMPQRDRTSNLRYLLRRGVPRNRVKRILITPGKSLCRIPPHRARDSTGAVTPMDSATLFCEKPNRLRFSLSSCYCSHTDILAYKLITV